MPKKAVVALLLTMLFLGACGDGEDRPGSVSSEDGSGTGTGSGTGSGSGNGSGTMHHETTAETFPAAEAEVTVDVAMKDFEFVMPTTVKAGKVLFRIKNDGPTEHEFLILQGSKELIELEAIASGKSGELAVVLKPGRYTASCHVGSGGARHDKLGMVKNFTVE